MTSMDSCVKVSENNKKKPSTSRLAHLPLLQFILHQLLCCALEVLV